MLELMLSPHFLLAVAGLTFAGCCFVLGLRLMWDSWQVSRSERPALGVVGRQSKPQGDPASGGVVRLQVAAPVAARPARPADPSSGCDCGDLLLVAAVAYPLLSESGVSDASSSDDACDDE